LIAGSRPAGGCDVSFRTLNARAILQTLETLERRIGERFPGAGLIRVCHDLVEVGRDSERRSLEIATPNRALRAAVGVVIAAGIAGLIAIALTVKLQLGNPEIFGVFQGVEAAMNIVVLVGAALFFAVSLERRIKRRRALTDLHAFRSIAHVIDMHQLTKDPGSILQPGPTTPSSPVRRMNRFELTRYLDYCSELLSLTGKLAALYAQNMPDPVVIDAVNDIEDLTSNMSRKIWQKISILESYDGAAGARQLSERPPPVGGAPTATPDAAS
jgi:hypothetical protein